jgi:hypothetical protein
MKNGTHDPRAVFKMNPVSKGTEYIGKELKSDVIVIFQYFSGYDSLVLDKVLKKIGFFLFWKSLRTFLFLIFL